MKTVVVDASVAIKWVLVEPGRDAAMSLLGRSALIAPELILAECGNVLWKRIRTGQLARQTAEDCFSVLCRAPVNLVAVADIAPLALRLAADLDHPVYDCLYLALGVERNAQVVTADRRFHAAASRHPYFGSTVQLLGAS